jgi:hypothetical protein
MNDPDLGKIFESLRHVGWKHARPDEPWHFTWGPSV